MSNLYSLYDVKAGTYSQPFVANTDDEAKRILLDICTKSDNLISQHPEDYSVYFIGEFDKYTGLIVGNDASLFVACANELVRSYNRELILKRENEKKELLNSSNSSNAPIPDNVVSIDAAK